MATPVGKTFLSSNYNLCANGRYSNKCTAAGVDGSAGYAKSIMLDSFEYGTIPLSRTTPGNERYQWEHDDTDSGGNLREGTLDLLATSEAPYGAQCLRDIVTSGGVNQGSMFIRYYNNHSAGAVNEWKYVRETAGIPIEDLGRYNRMRFWLKAPSVQNKASSLGNTNFHFGSYLRDPNDSESEQESDNNHWYHYYNLEYVDNWVQVIVDSHPNHQRGTDSAVEEEIQAEPYPGYTYFDVMTYFYITDIRGTSGYPATWLVDGFELYEEPYDEDINHIYSLHGALSKVTPNELIVGWKRIKHENDKLFNVRYAFTSFHENGGWSHGVDAPGGQNIEPPNSNGYNGVEYRTDAIDLLGKDVIYIAIKHQDEATKFRQIRIPLTDAGYPAVGGS